MKGESTIYVEVIFAVAIDVGDHYEGATTAEQAEAAADDPDFTEWLTNEMECVEFVRHDVVTDAYEMDRYRDIETRRFLLTLGDIPTPWPPEQVEVGR